MVCPQTLVTYMADHCVHKTIVITRIPWQCALSIHEWGLANDPESEHTIRTCLYSMGVAAETVSRCSDYELEQIVESGSYDRLLDGLQFWIELACKREDVNAELTIREEQYGKLWERHRAKLSKLLLLGGHTSSITSISFSADGLRLVSGSRDKTVRVWDLKTGEKVAILQGHTWDVNSVAFSADGSRVISGSDDNTVRVWDLQTRGKVTVFQGHSMPITSVAFSADGSRVVSGSSDSTVRVWDSQTGGNIAVLQGHTDWVNSVVFSADGSRVISGSDDKTVRVWDSQTGENVAVLQGHTDWVNSVAFSTDGSCIVSGSSDNSVRVWDSQTGENVAIFEDHTDSVTSVAFLSDGLHIISHDKNGNPHSWGSKTYLPSCPLPTSTISSSHSPLEFIFHSGWLLCKRANDNCAYRLHPVAENLVPSIPIKLFGSLFAYGTNETIIIVNFSRYTEYIGHISSV
jgi:WD40 repeat protein